MKVPIPWFMGGFILASAIGSYVPAVATVVPFLVQAAYIILGMAMAALGLNVNFSVIAKEGVRPMAGASCAPSSYWGWLVYCIPLFYLGI